MSHCRFAEKKVLLFHAATDRNTFHMSNLIGIADWISYIHKTSTTQGGMRACCGTKAKYFGDTARSLSVMRVLEFLFMFSSFSQAFHSSARRLRFRCRLSSTDTKVSEGIFWNARVTDWRPTLDDVERISWGKPAKRKGTGSRGVPHRLNDEERTLFEQARSRGFLEVAGSGWRKQRRDSPLLNSYRLLCDARARVSIVLHKGNTGIDVLAIDLSPLRYPEMFDDIAKACLGNHDGGKALFELEVTESLGDDIGKRNEEDTQDSKSDVNPWEGRPIHQLPCYSIEWELPRSDAKKLGKKMSRLFDTAEGKTVKSKKPYGVKAGKSRRHGGFGIG